MKLTSKATLIVISTMLFTITSGLLAREFFINPKLRKIEHAADSRDIRRFEQAVERYRENLQSRVKRIYAAAGLLESLDKRVDWSPVVEQLAHIGGYEELDYFILADENGRNASVHAGELITEPQQLPSAAVVQQVLAIAIAKLDSASDITTSELLLSSADGPLIFAAGRGSWHSAQLPATYVAVRRVDSNMIASLGERLGLTVAAISHEESLQQRQHYGIELGQRSRDDTLYSLLKNRQGDVILHMRFNTAPRAFDDDFFSPIILSSLAVAILAWAFVLLLMQHSILRPIEQLSSTMRRIRQSSNYRERLVYRNRDELGKLVDECNELLNHVAAHTQQLEAYSYKDALTGIGNRRLFQERLDYQWRLARRKTMPLSAIVFDLDYFKQYNDCYGHDGGDSVLREFATLLEQTFSRDTDVVARTGGEEFIVLLLDVDLNNARALAENALNALRQRAIPHAAAPQRNIVSASAGVACAVPQSGDNSESLIRQADAALYRAKQMGRDQIAVHDASNTGN